jgi:hypothetical protein
MHQVVSDWENWCRNLSGINICFQRGSNLAESRNGMTSVKDAEYSGCLPTGRMWNIFTVFGMKVDLRLWTFSIICVEL